MKAAQLLITLCVAALPLSLGGCAESPVNSSLSDADTRTISPAPDATTVPDPARGRIIASRAHVYDTLAELRKDSSDVVVVTAGDQEVAVDKVGSLPFSVTTVRIEEVLGDSKDLRPGQTILVRQLGSDVTAADDVQLLAPDGAYLLYLQPFTFKDGKPTGQYAPTGAQAGVYKADTVESKTYSKTDTESPDLPAAIAKDEAAQPR